MLGTVKWFNHKIGYGFITDQNGKDYFVHHTNIDMEGYRILNDGDTVEFEVGVSQKGEHAVKVKLIKKAERKAKRSDGKGEGTKSERRGGKNHG